MVKKESEIMLPDEEFMNKIYLIRGKNVMLDRDLAEHCGIYTGQLKHYCSALQGRRGGMPAYLNSLS